jgi:hypothetical protein
MLLSSTMSSEELLELCRLLATPAELLSAELEAIGVALAPPPPPPQAASTRLKETKEQRARGCMGGSSMGR